mmetsp:Transcript_46758/g.52293  ORF Transcript_46758/g.52293 Transcript_46758/m.52293 type:complete len:574 (+) Transcript_46758:185-1906(+)
MPRLAILAVCLSTLSWSGESFVYPIIATDLRTCTSSECCQKPIHVGSTSQIGDQQTSQSPPYSPFSSFTIRTITSYRSSSACKSAWFNSDPSSSSRGEKHGRGGRNTNNGANRKGLHRRIFGRIPWRRGQSKSSLPSSSSPVSSSSLRAPLQIIRGKTKISEDETSASTNNFKDPLVVYHEDDDFIARNFDTINPGSVLPVVPHKAKLSSSSSSSLSSHSISLDSKEQEVDRAAGDIGYHSKLPLTIDSEYFDVAIIPAVTVTDNGNASAIAKKGGLPSATKLICRFLENILTERIGNRWPTELPEDLTIDVRPSLGKYNNIGRLFRGHLCADAKLSSGRIVFHPIRFSSVKLELKEVTLNLLGFFLSNKNKNEQQQQQKRQDQKQNVRYPKQFDLHIEDLIMTRHDLLFSPCVKNGLRRLLINVLQDRGLQSSSIEITCIDILPTGKISCKGEAKTHFGSAPLHFEVRTGISRSNRGHVLTFPGLEISLNRDIGLFVPVVPTLDLDVGHNTIFHSVVIDGKQKQLKIEASVTITPSHTLRLMQDYVQTRDAFSARFFYDVGRWLTKMGNFSK